MSKTYRHYTFDTPKVKVVTERCFLKNFEDGKIKKLKKMEILHKEDNHLDIFICSNKKQLKKQMKKVKKFR